MKSASFFDISDERLNKWLDRIAQVDLAGGAVYEVMGEMGKPAVEAINGLEVHL